MTEDKKEEPARPFALDLSEAQVLWEEYDKGRKDKPNANGVWIDAFMHARGWRIDHGREAGAPFYKEERAYELHPQPLWALEAIRNHLGVVNDPQTIVNAVRELSAAFAVLERIAMDGRASSAPIPMRLLCPECYELHIDVGEFATKAHHTHACQECGNVWRPAVVATVGVQFLPGFRNE